MNGHITVIAGKNVKTEKLEFGKYYERDEPHLTLIATRKESE